MYDKGFASSPSPSPLCRMGRPPGAIAPPPDRRCTRALQFIDPSMRSSHPCMEYRPRCRYSRQLQKTACIMPGIGSERAVSFSPPYWHSGDSRHVSTKEARSLLRRMDRPSVSRHMVPPICELPLGSAWVLPLQTSLARKKERSTAIAQPVCQSVGPSKMDVPATHGIEARFALPASTGMADKYGLAL